MGQKKPSKAISIPFNRGAIQAFVALVFLIFTPKDVPAADELILATIDGSADVEAGVAVVKEAYQHLGIDVKVRWMKDKNALAQSDSGKVDGEVQRIDGINRTYANLIQVPIPVNFLHGAAFSKKHSFPITGWYSLKPYRVGIVEGIVFSKETAQGIQIKTAESYEELVAMLDRDKIDVAVMPRTIGMITIKKQKIKGVKALGGVLETFFLYHYLHRKNEHLVPMVEKELKRMLLDGTTKRIQSDTYARFLARGN